MERKIFNLILDNEQLLASNYLENHSIIIAGAGSGKTTTLIKKVENIINSGVKESEILVLSFTNENVNNFIKKCKYNIEVKTFHKAAFKYVGNNYEVADDNIIDGIIDNYLNNIPTELKKRIFYIKNKKYLKFTNQKYIGLIKDESCNSIFKIIKNTCKIVKTNNINIDKINSNKFNNDEIILLYISKKILSIYNKELKDNKLLDFDDIILKATNNLKNSMYETEYKHILVDEFQDISKIRLDFLKALINRSNAILTVVGDDWQSIYRFSGSNIKIFHDFKKEFPNSKKFYITNTYRCPKNLVKISSKFILKNKYQTAKKLVSHNNTKSKIRKIYQLNCKNKLYYLIKKIATNKSVLILSRNTFDIKKFISNKLKYENNTIILDNIKRENIKYMTLHSSKGLEADIVIILNLSSDKDGLPGNKEIELYNKIIDIKEPIKNAEDRRLFYVGLTRSKSDVFLFIDPKKPSIFIRDI